MIELSKRGLLTGAAALAASSSILPVWRRAEAATNSYDLIVVGAGTAGMPAAIFAAERGAKVLVIEKAPVLGGTLDRSNGQMAASRTQWQKAKGIEDSPDMHYEDNMRINNHTADPVLTRLFVDNAPDTLAWLAASGFKALDNHPVLGGGHEPFTTPRYQWGADNGKTIFKTMLPLFEKAVASGKVTSLMSTGAVDLIQDKNGAVVGVVAEDDSGGRKDYMGKNVIISSGGCASNPRMFRDLHNVDLTTEVAYPFSQGQGITLGLGAGGYVRGGEKYACLFGNILTDNHYPSPAWGGLNTNATARPPWEVWVNVDGQRFLAEDAGGVDPREKALLRQPGQRMFVIASQDTMDKAPPLMPRKKPEEFMKEFGVHPLFHKGATLHEVAVKAGINPYNLANTVGAYNRALKEGATDPLGRKHRPTELTTGPFYAIQLTGWTVISFAGLGIDGQLRVTRADGTPIPNLYAAGEVIGAGATSGWAYTNGSLVTPALTFGRLLGQRMLKFNA